MATYIATFYYFKFSYNYWDGNDNFLEYILNSPIVKMFHLLEGKTHGYNTRYKSLPTIKKHTSTDYNKSFLCKGITYYNQLK